MHSLLKLIHGFDRVFQEDSFRLLATIVLAGTLYVFLEVCDLLRDLEQFLAARHRPTPPAPCESEKSQDAGNPEQSAAGA